MRALVTGANGFIGSYVVEELFKRGFEVISLVRKKSNLQWIENLKTNLIFCDSISQESLSDVIKGLNEIDYVFHIAGVVRACTIREFYEVNDLATKNVIRASREIKPTIKKFVYLSSLEVCGPSLDGSLIKEDCNPSPITDYGKSKLRGEEEVLRFKDLIPITVIRPTGVFGPRDGDFLSFFKLARKGIIPLVNKGENLVSLCYVEDLAKAVVDLSESTKSTGNIYNISDGNEYTAGYIADVISNVVGNKVKRINISKEWFYRAGFIAECISKLKKEPNVFNRQKALVLSHNWVCDIQKIKNDIGFSPSFNLEEAVRKTFNWYLEKGWL